MNLDFATPAVYFRRRAGLTQVAAARKIGVSNIFLCEVEKGRKRPGWDTFLAMCELYGTTPVDFFKNKGMK